MLAHPVHALCSVLAPVGGVTGFAQSDDAVGCTETVRTPRAQTAGGQVITRVTDGGIDNTHLVNTGCVVVTPNPVAACTPGGDNRLAGTAEAQVEDAGRRFGTHKALDA